MATFVPNAGLALIVSRILGTGTEPKYVAWGTGSGATQTSTALVTPAPEARVLGTSSAVTTDVTGDTYQVVGTLTASAARAITEAGLFDASTAGNMFLYGDFSVINLATNDSIEFTMKVDFD
jgi:hypothetical protein